MELLILLPNYYSKIFKNPNWEVLDNCALVKVLDWALATSPGLMKESHE